MNPSCMNCRANIRYDTSPQTISGALTRSEYFKIPPLRFARAFCLFVLAVLVCNVAVPCWFAYQRAATVRVTVLHVQGGRFARPSTHSAYTYTPSGSSPAQHASPSFGPFRYRPEPWPRLASSGVRRGARWLGLPPAPCAAAPVVACRSVRHSPPRPLPHLPQGAFFFEASALADVSSARLPLPLFLSRCLPSPNDIGKV